MQEEKLFRSIFRQGSKTYFFSSFFFPPHIKKKVSILYAFVRVADNFVDTNPQQKEAFYNFVNDFQICWSGQNVENKVITAFVELAKSSHFEKAWIEAFLKSMEMDLYKSSYQHLSEVLEYIYGSAEVVGLMMAKILSLPEVSYPYARLLGRAMQFINFIRDVNEDSELGRTYLPNVLLQKHSLSSLDELTCRKNLSAFTGFIDDVLTLYFEWQREAELGFQYIPKRYLIPIKTASEMYKWTGKTIGKNPLIVFQRKVKPAVSRIFLNATFNAVTLRS
jgi:15-cis-phytoene synthase